MAWPVGKTPDDAHRTKISQAKKGKPQPEITPEERARINEKISDGVKKAHARRKGSGF